MLEKHNCAFADVTNLRFKKFWKWYTGMDRNANFMDPITWGGPRYTGKKSLLRRRADVHFVHEPLKAINP